jgi:hypothetical protein
LTQARAGYDQRNLGSDWPEPEGNDEGHRKAEQKDFVRPASNPSRESTI